MLPAWQTASRLQGRHRATTNWSRSHTLAEHVERVAETMPRHHALPLLIIDECGPRVNELATAHVG
jgi:hypothetical protein